MNEAKQVLEAVLTSPSHEYHYEWRGDKFTVLIGEKVAGWIKKEYIAKPITVGGKISAIETLIANLVVTHPVYYLTLLSKQAGDLPQQRFLVVATNGGDPRHKENIIGVIDLARVFRTSLVGSELVQLIQEKLKFIDLLTKHYDIEHFLPVKPEYQVMLPDFRVFILVEGSRTRVLRDVIKVKAKELPKQKQQQTQQSPQQAHQQKLQHPQQPQQKHQSPQTKAEEHPRHVDAWIIESMHKTGNPIPVGKEGDLREFLFEISHKIDWKIKGVVNDIRNDLTVPVELYKEFGIEVKPHSAKEPIEKEYHRLRRSSWPGPGEKPVKIGNIIDLLLNPQAKGQEIPAGAQEPGKQIPSTIKKD